MRALLIVNPAAGRRHAGPDDLERSIAILRNAGIRLDPVETGPDGPTASDLARWATSEGYDACIVAGGDGTVAPAAAVLVDTPVTLGILPFGSFMNIARGIGIPFDAARAAELIARGSVHAIDVGEVHGHRFFETAGIGLDAELFLAARHAERGSWRRLWRRIVRWLTHRTHDVVVTVDGEAHGHRVMQILVLNSPYYAWSLPVVPDGTMEDGQLDVAVFPRMGRLALLRSLVAVWRLRPLPVRPVRYHGASIEITSPAALTVHADGADAGTLPATLRCRRGALRVYA